MSYYPFQPLSQYIVLIERLIRLSKERVLSTRHFFNKFIVESFKVDSFQRRIVPSTLSSKCAEV